MAKNEKYLNCKGYIPSPDGKFILAYEMKSNGSFITYVSDEEQKTIQEMIKQRVSTAISDIIYQNSDSELIYTVKNNS